MDVYFGENYWGESRGKRPGRKVPVEKEFVWDGHKWRIPAFYICEEGIVVDLCARIPMKEVEEFLEKWSFARRSRAEDFTDEEIEQLERESPFIRNLAMQAEVDCCKLESDGWCGTGWHPFSGEEEAVTETEEMLMNAYGCTCDSGWYFCRAHFRFPGTFDGGVGGRVSQLSGNSRHYLTVFLEKEAENVPGPYFSSKAGETGKRIEFMHPVSGQLHVLTVEQCEQKCMEQIKEQENRMGPIRIRRVPTHYLHLKYTVEPDITEEELRVCDCESSDPPELEEGSGSASVGMIGGANGPTAIFFAGKYEKEFRGRQVYSALHYEPVEEVRWRMVFRVKEEEEMKVRMEF